MRATDRMSRRQTRRSKQMKRKRGRKRLMSRRQHGGFAPLLGGLMPSSVLMKVLHERLTGGQQTPPPVPPKPIEMREVKGFYPRKDETAPKEINGVPLVIYRTWNEKKIPAGMLNAIEESMKMTPEFDNYFYDDKDCLKFIQENFDKDVVKAFQCLKPGAYKADLWRYCILYTNGGVYTDSKIVIKTPLVPILKEHPKLYMQDTPQGREHCSPNFPGIWNGIMWTPPKNPTLKVCIEEIVENCRKRDYKMNPLDITGPCLFGKKVVELEGINAIRKSPFVHKNPKTYHYKDTVLAIEYPEYRNEQTSNPVPHYGGLYNNRDVYDKNITFE